MIINFDFGYDEFGVRYLNRLETEVNKVYIEMFRQSEKFKVESQSEIIPAMIQFLRKWRDHLTGYYEEAA